MGRTLAFGGAIFAVGLVAAACGSSSSTTTPAATTPATSPAATSSASTAPATAVSTSAMGSVHVATVTGVGTVLVDASGRTLYLFTPDKQKKATCTATCAKSWPPLDVTGKPAAGSGIQASLLGTVKSAGKTQLTYDHWPLYTFAGDSKAGQANGEGVEGSWFAVTSSGQKAQKSTTAPASTPTTAASAPTTAAAPPTTKKSSGGYGY